MLRKQKSPASARPPGEVHQPHSLTMGKLIFPFYRLVNTSGAAAENLFAHQDILFIGLQAHGKTGPSKNIAQILRSAR
jgi:hypothetical protein